MDKVYTRVSDQNGAYIPLRGAAYSTYIAYIRGYSPRGVGGEGPILRINKRQKLPEQNAILAVFKGLLRSSKYM